MSFHHKLAIEFLGAARTVTGSRTKVTFDQFQCLVDCGLYQGPKELRLLNWDKLEGLNTLNAVILTHAHIDHSGYLPKIVKDGFRGPVYCSELTLELCEIMLRDSAHIQEEDAKYLGSRNLSHFHPPKPLYTAGDAELALKQLKPIPLDEWVEIGPKVSLRLLRAGHILGATFVQLAFDKSNGVEIMTFSGDLGNSDQYVIKGPVNLSETDYLILEGTYGDKNIDRHDVPEKLAKVVNSTYDKRGVLVIPAFAVGRTQELLHILSTLKEEERIPDVKIYVDSPMANETTDLFQRHSQKLKPYFINGRIDIPLRTDIFKAVGKLEDSISLCAREGPIIVISASGMLSGGRILHHLKSRLTKPENTVLFVGYQAEETKGKLLQSGLKKIRIHKQLIEVKAEIHSIDGLSAHADSDEIISWVSNLQKSPKRTFLNHGRYEALRCLQYRLKTELKLKSIIPKPMESFEL